MSENKIKKAVIREDLLAITGDFRRAIILNQFIYWSERVSDADKFIEKENEIAQNNGEESRELFYGWIYKSAEELSDEVMLGLSASQIRKYIKDLDNLGYISKRNNPKYKWDRTLQYRVNLVNIARALKEKGYPLSDYRINISDVSPIARPCAINCESSENQSQSDKRAIPEITTDTTKDKNKYASEDKKQSSEDQMYALFSKETKGGRPVDSSRVDYTVDYLESYVSQVVDKIMLEEHGFSDRSFAEDNLNLCDELKKIILYFYDEYNKKFAFKHPIISYVGYANVVDRYLNPGVKNMDEYGVFDFDTYKAMIDKYFTVDYNKHGKYSGEVNLSLSHFMSGPIREHLLCQMYDEGI